MNLSGKNCIKKKRKCEDEKEIVPLSVVRKERE
jgi:hypothetical protein